MMDRQRTAAPTLIETLLALDPASELGRAIGERRAVFDRTELSFTAALAPEECGGIGQGLRAALACRMARQLGDPALAKAYEAMIPGTDSGNELLAIADPADPTPLDRRLAAIRRHVDVLTLRPRDATRDDISALTASGVDQSDIVRLAGLAAFVNYQARVLAGLRLLGETG